MSDGSFSPRSSDQRKRLPIQRPHSTIEAAFRKKTAEIEQAPNETAEAGPSIASPPKTKRVRRAHSSVTINSETTAEEYRRLGNDPTEVVLLADRISLIIVGVWLSKAKKEERIKMRILASIVGREIISNGIDSKDVAQRLFPEALADLVVEKAKLLADIGATSRLSEDVRDLAYCHASSKVQLSKTSLEALRRYVAKLLREAPTREAFNDSEDSEDWWPDFNE